MTYGRYEALQGRFKKRANRTPQKYELKSYILYKLNHGRTEDVLY